MSHHPHHDTLDRLDVRSYTADDHPHVSRLYTEGLLDGKISPNDTGADIEHIDDAYFSDPASHLWIAEMDGQIVGMIGVARDQEHTAEIRRLRVQQQWQGSPLGARLMETALQHCKLHGFLKVVLDTRFDADAVRDLFDRFGFLHTRTKTLHGKELPEFYLDLYRSPTDDGQD